MDGYGRIASDEQRHIAYGTWFLREAVVADPAMADVVRERVLGLLPAVAESVSPPGETARTSSGPWGSNRGRSPSTGSAP